MLLPLVDRWAHESQLGSRRNAMVAATALARRRIERKDAEAFLAARELAPAVALAPRTVEVTAAAR
jgi:hypothetical protein